MGAQNERVTKVANDIMETITERMIAHGVTHEEYHQIVDYLNRLGLSGEVPLFLDVFFEGSVEQAANAGKAGSDGCILGPFHVPDAPVLSAPYKMPMRSDEPGTPFVFTATVTDLDRKPLSGVSVDVWHSGNDGFYSGFGSSAPTGNLRGIMESDDQGVVRFSTIRPAPYPIPTNGPTGQFLALTGRHEMRPAHFHFILKKDGYDTLTSQIYFKGDQILEGPGDVVVNAVKDSLIIEVGKGEDQEVASAHGISAPYETGEYNFIMRPSA